MPINNVTIGGNTTRDAEVHQTNSGTVVVEFSVAVNERRKDRQTGEWSDVPHFFDVTKFCTTDKQTQFFGGLAKGTKVVVSGRLAQDRWQDSQTGQNRSKVKVIADDVEVMARQDGQQYAPPPAQYAPPPAQAQYAPQPAQAQQVPLPYQQPYGQQGYQQQ